MTLPDKFYFSSLLLLLAVVAVVVVVVVVVVIVGKNIELGVTINTRSLPFGR
jgi:hypothetical protein